jgi:hypothetical protein
MSAPYAAICGVAQQETDVLGGMGVATLESRLAAELAPLCWTPLLHTATGGGNRERASRTAVVGVEIPIPNGTKASIGPSPPAIVMALHTVPSESSEL